MQVSQKFHIGAPLIVLGAVIVLAAAAAPQVAHFSGRGARTTEKQNVQSAMDIMLADRGITRITALDLDTGSVATNDFTSQPIEGPLNSYLGQNPTTYYYCWSATGLVLEQFITARECTK